MDLYELGRLQSRIRDRLDDAATARGEQRGRHLQAAVRSARDAIGLVLNSEDFWADVSTVATAANWRDNPPEHHNAITRILTDIGTFELFLAAERRLLSDIGMPTASIDDTVNTIRDLKAYLSSPPDDIGATNGVAPQIVEAGTVGQAGVTALLNLAVELHERLEAVSAELDAADTDLAAGQNHRRWRRIARYSLQALAGLTLAGVNASAVVATLGLGAPAGAVSVAAGGAVAADGITRLRD